MSTIISYIAYVLGFLMDFFFRGLTAIGYPRMWACIVLFSAVTRFFFLPRKIKSYRSQLLTPIANQELLSADPNFFEKTKNAELTVERAALKKQVYKKYKISSNFGCLTTLIQFPLLAALFYIVKNPQEFVPSLEVISNAAPNVNTLLGLPLSSIPLDGVLNGTQSAAILCVPVFVMLSSVFKMFPSLKLTKTASQKLKVYGLCVLFTLMIGWFSAKLPLAISLYWVANDITDNGLNVLVRKIVLKNKFVSATIYDYKQKLVQQKEAEAKVTTNDTEQPALADEPGQKEQAPASAVSADADSLSSV